LALIFNGAIALAREFLADRLPELDEWEEKFGRPVLATVPTLELKSASEVVSKPELSELSGPMRATESLAGSSRWIPDSSGGARSA
jgi:hypothetical protein